MIGICVFLCIFESSFGCSNMVTSTEWHLIHWVCYLLSVTCHACPMACIDHTLTLCILLCPLSLFVTVHIINITGIVIDEKKSIKYSGRLGCIYFLSLLFGLDMVWVGCVSWFAFFFQLSVASFPLWAIGREQCCQSRPPLIPTRFVLNSNTYFLPSIFPRLCKQELSHCSVQQLFYSTCAIPK